MTVERDVGSIPVRFTSNRRYYISWPAFLLLRNHRAASGYRLRADCFYLRRKMVAENYRRRMLSRGLAGSPRD